MTDKTLRVFFSLFIVPLIYSIDYRLAFTLNHVCVGENGYQNPFWYAARWSAVVFCVTTTVRIVEFATVLHVFARDVWKEPENDDKKAAKPSPPPPHFTAHRRVSKVVEEKIW